ncbi:MAG: carboxypeptidase-like regulatory domain-containing protein [Acidobacteriaceae bacterium]
MKVLHSSATFCTLLAACTLLPVIRSFAQATTASVHGTVTDPNGAVLANASVTALNTSTGIAVSQQTDSKGNFVFPDLHIGGPYSITVEDSGFQRFVVSGIILDLSSARQVDARLRIGSSSETVRVSSEEVEVESSDVQLKDVIGAQELEDLPTLGRDAVQLQKTAPGTVEASDREATFSTNGSQTQENSYLLDGTDINDFLLNQPGITVNPDALAEINVISSTIDPEFSRNSGAIVDEALKSGTDQFHGDGFEFYRDTFLNNGNYFSATRPGFHQNVFGGTLGGPIIKNRTFFFLAYQGLRNRTAQTQITPVFSADQRGGHFSADEAQFSSKPIPFPGGLNGPSGPCPAGTPWNVCFPDAQIPKSNFNPIAVNLLNKYVPAPNYNNAGIGYFNFNAPNTSADDQGIVRIDDQVTSKDALWASVIFDSSPATNTLPLPATESTGTGATLPGFAADNSSHTKIFSGSWTHVFNSTTLNELRTGYFRFNYKELEPAAATLAAPSSFGFDIVPQDAAAGTLPYINVNGYFALGFSTNGPQPRKDENYTFFDNFSKVAGNHDLKFGVNVERFIISNPYYTDNSGAFNFNASATYSTGDPAADFLLGIPATYNQGSGFFVDVRASQYYAYAQDHWKASSALTLAYGLGYEVETPYANLQYDGVGVTCWYATDAQSKVFSGAPPGTLYPGDPGCNKNGGPTSHWDHFSPRLGFAWSPEGGFGVLTGPAGKRAFVVRGGLGLYWNRVQGEGAQVNSNDPPFSENSVGAAGLGGNPGFANPFADIADTPGASYPANPFPYSVPRPGQNVNFMSLYPLEMDNLTSDVDVPYTYNYNLNIQRALPSNMVLTVGYVGSLGRKLIRAREGDPITQQGHDACLNGTGAGAPIMIGGQTFTCLQLIGSQSLYFPGEKLQPGVIPGSQIPGVLPNGVPYYLSIGGMHTSGISSYNALQVSLAKAPSHGLYFSLAYTYSHALDNASSLEDSVANGYGTNYVPGFENQSYGDSVYDARQRLAALYNYEIPVAFRGSALLRSALNGWHFSGITALQTGFPITIYDEGVFNSLYCDQFSFVNCPDVPNTSTFHIHTENPRNPGHYWFNTATFTQEPIGTFGNVKRNFFHGPGFNYSNFEVYKNFAVGESQAPRYIQLRLEAYNAFNHANFANPSGNFGAGPTVFGVIDSVDQPINAGGDPQPGRAIQLAGKFYF